MFCITHLLQYFNISISYFVHVFSGCTRFSISALTFFVVGHQQKFVFSAEVLLFSAIQLVGNSEKLSSQRKRTTAYGKERLLVVGVSDIDTASFIVLSHRAFDFCIVYLKINLNVEENVQYICDVNFIKIYEEILDIYYEYFIIFCYKIYFIIYIF